MEKFEKNDNEQLDFNDKLASGENENNEGDVKLKFENNDIHDEDDQDDTFDYSNPKGDNFGKSDWNDYVEAEKQSDNINNGGDGGDGGDGGNDDKKNSELVYSLDFLMSERFGRYAKYIIQERALPDARDGLKPVQRRILYAMNDLRLFHNTAYKKTARIVGEVIGKYHPHGDTSVNDALVRMSQKWKLRYPLIDMHGNNGSIDGDPAAAMRYTEARLTEMASFLLMDLEKDTIDFNPNFDDSEIEPVVLPGRIPNLLLNGATGIAAGYATNIPPHNILEIIDGVIHQIINPDCTIRELMNFVKGPDFPTKGIIQGKKGIQEAYTKGKGKIIVRSNFYFEDKKMVIDEIPYDVVKKDLVRKLDDARYNEPSLLIKEVRDETDRNGLRIVLELNDNANQELIRKYLLKNTNLQISYNLNIVTIINQQPKLTNLKQLFQAFIGHQVEVITRRSKFLLGKYTKRLEIIDGLIKAISILDKVIKTIRASANRQNAIDNLTSKYKFTDVQSTAIVQLRLYRLTSTDIVKVEQERGELINKINRLKTILNYPNELNNVIVDQLSEVRNKYKDSVRLSQIENKMEAIEIDNDETILEEKVAIWVSRDGYLKCLEKSAALKVKIDSFAHKPQDIFVANFITSNLNKLLLITDKGNYVIIPIHKIGKTKNKDIGEHINKIAQLPNAEKILQCIIINNFDNKDDYKIATISSEGFYKQTLIKDLEATRLTKALTIMKLKDDDYLVNAQLISNDDTLVLMTKNGFIFKHSTMNFTNTGPKSLGVKTLKLVEDKVVGGYLYNNEDNLSLTSINNRDGIKKVLLRDIEYNRKFTKGIAGFNKTPRSKIQINYVFITNKSTVLSLLDNNNMLIDFNLEKIRNTSIKTNFTHCDLSNVVQIVLPKYYKLIT